MLTQPLAIHTTRPPLGALFLTWLHIGATSFGGGAVVQYLIQEHFIHKRQWLTAEDYARILAMCQITPGLTIIAITITIGKRLGGWLGMWLSLAGLVLPSALITVGMTALFASVRELPPVQASLRAIFAAIFGISLATTWRNVQHILVTNRNHGRLSLAVVLAIVSGGGLLYLWLKPPVIVLYVLGGMCGAWLYSHRR
jgi:chromate transporter